MTDDDQFLADLQAMADRAHASDPEASTVPNFWLRVLAAVNRETESTTERNQSMNIHVAQPVIFAEGIHTPANTQARGMGERIRRYANFAATIALVLAVAIGGWLAMSQLPSGDPDPRFAVLPATPEGITQTCDVEPLSVDRVMEIVKNPDYFMSGGPTSPRAETAMMGSPADAELWEVDAPLELIGGMNTPSQQQFGDASAVADEYVNCMVFGTQGQVWSFYSPALLQAAILAEFPVFAAESEVRARVEERLSEPAYEGEFAWEMLPFITDLGVVSVNPDYQLALLQASESSYFDWVIKIGVSLKSADGKQIALTNGTGRDLIPNDPMGGTNDVFLYVTLAKIRSGDTWLVIPWPSEEELGR